MNYPGQMEGLENCAGFQGMSFGKTLAARFMLLTLVLGVIGYGIIRRKHR